MGDVQIGNLWHSGVLAFLLRFPVLFLTRFAWDLEGESTKLTIKEIFFGYNINNQGWEFSKAKINITNEDLRL